MDGYDLVAYPPSDDRPHGVFATRSPQRPSPIGHTVDRLLRRDGRRLHVRGVDMLDGTPVLDIKPYLLSVPPDELRRGSPKLNSVVSPAADALAAAPVMTAVIRGGRRIHHLHWDFFLLPQALSPVELSSNQARSDIQHRHLGISLDASRAFYDRRHMARRPHDVLATNFI